MKRTIVSLFATLLLSTALVGCNNAETQCECNDDVIIVAIAIATIFWILTFREMDK